MPSYKVRAGRLLAHEGREIPAGEIVILPVTVGVEVASMGLVDEVDAAGNPVLRVVSALDVDLERARPHERASLIEAEIQVVAQRLDELRAQLAAEQAAEAARVAAATPDVPKRAAKAAATSAGHEPAKE